MDARMGRVARKLRRVAADTVEAGSERIGGSREGVAARLERARDRLFDMEREAVYRARRAALDSDRYAHRHPWRIAGIGVAFGVAVGLATRLVRSRGH